MEQTGFYVIGIALVLAALGLSAIGLREERFPSKAALRGGVALFALLVLGTAAAAVVNARDEQEHREAELATEEGGEEAEGSDAPGAEAPAGGRAEEAGGGPPVKVSAVSTGDLAFEQKALEAKAGATSFEFTNPAPIDHDFVIETQDGEEIARTEVITDSTDTTEADLEPRKYTFFCSVAGHREAGMEGTLTVK